MKPKKILSNLKTIWLPVCLLLFAVSCAQEDSPKAGIRVNPMFRIKVTVPESKTISTRALGETLETVQDLNIVVYFDDMNPKVFYLDASDSRLPLNAGTERTFDITDLNVALVDRLSVYLLANYGEPLSVSDIATPDDLKGIKLTMPAGSILPENCVMFAYAGTVVPAEEADNNNCVFLNAPLIRTLAKVTLSIEGSGTLKEGLRITPKYFRIMNVPKEMWLVESAGRKNKASETNIAEYGYEMPLNMDFIVQGKSASDHNSSASALYLFENKQGGKENNDDGEIGKEATGIFKYASYIEVEANYSYFHHDGNSQTQVVGDIIYRFCLGSDKYKDYNVLRNNHYQVTLVLNNWGGAKEGGMVDDNGRILVGTSDPDASWRVDLDLSDWGFTGNSNIGGSAYYGSFGLSTNSSIKIVQVDWTPLESNKWAGVRRNSSNGKWKDLVAESSASTSEGFFQFYIKPWRVSDGYPAIGSPQYKDVQIHLEPASGTGMADDFVIRQWTPIMIGDGLYMERFEDHNMLLAPWLSSSGTVPANISADDPVGWNNTLLIRQNSPAAQITLRRAGIYWGAIEGIAEAIPNPFYNEMTSSVNAAIYLPSKAELEIMLNFTGNVTDPYNTYLPLESNADYWTSTANSSGEVCYWDGMDHVFKYTSDLTSLKRVRAVYRPSLDSGVMSLSGLPWQ